MPYSWFGLLFQIVFWLVSMMLFRRWMHRARLRSQPPCAAGTLSQPPEVLAIGAVVAIMFSVITVICVDRPDAATMDWPALFLLAPALLGLWLVADYVFARHTMDGAGMEYGRIFGRNGRFVWRDVDRVGFSQWTGGYWLTLASGEKVRIGGTMTGQPAFASHVLQHVPMPRIDADVSKMLAAAAQGKLHPL
jgi:hypothetical protein